MSGPGSLWLGGGRRVYDRRMPSESGRQLLFYNARID